MAKKTFSATARRALLRRGRMLLRRSEQNGAGPADFLEGLSDVERDELAEIHLALERISRGIYGQCEDCSQQMNEDRLAKRPWERLCASCDADATAAVASINPSATH